MDKIRLKENSKPIDLSAELLLLAYNDTKQCILNGAIKSTTTLGKVNIDGNDMFVSIIISDKNE